MYLVVRLVQGIVVGAYTVRHHNFDQLLRISDGRFEIPWTDQANLQYQVLCEGNELRLAVSYLTEINENHPLSDGLNVFRDGHGEPAVFVDFEVLRGWLRAVEIPEELIPFHYGYQSFERFFDEVKAGTANRRVYFEYPGEGRRLKKIHMTDGAQKSDFLKALCRYLDCFLDEEFLDALLVKNADESLHKLMVLLKDKAGITYKGLSGDGLSWLMLVNGEEKEYRPWVSRPGLAKVYLLHLVCKKYGYREVFQYLKGVDEPFSEREEAVLSFFEALRSKEDAIDYLRGRYQVLGLDLPQTDAFFSIDGLPFMSQHHLRQLPAPIGPLLRWHEGLGDLLVASIPKAARYKGVAFYPNHQATELNGGLLCFVDGDNRIPAFLNLQTVVLEASFRGVRQIKPRGMSEIGSNVLASDPEVIGVVSADTYGRGHVLKSGNVVFWYDGTRTKYLLLISRQKGCGGPMETALIELEVSGEQGNCSFVASLHDGPYEIRNGSVVVKKG